MEAEVDQQLGAEKSPRTDGRSGYRSGYRPRRLDTRMGTMYPVSYTHLDVYKRQTISSEIFPVIEYAILPLTYVAIIRSWRLDIVTSAPLILSLIHI